MKPENSRKKETISAVQMVAETEHIKAALLERLEAAVVDIEPEHLEKLNELSLRCMEAYRRLDELIERQNTDGSVKDTVFKFAYDNIKSVSAEVNTFLSQTPEERNALIGESNAAEAEKDSEKSFAELDIIPAAEDKNTNSEAVQTHYLAGDVERLKKGDPGILYQNGEERLGFKGLEELRLDIEAIFEAAGRSDEFDNFYKTKFRAIAHLINVNTELYTKVSPTERKNILVAMQKSYKQILRNASEWLRTEKVNTERENTELNTVSAEPSESGAPKRSPRSVPSNPGELHDQQVKDRLVKQLFSDSGDFLSADVKEGGKRRKKKIQDLKADIEAVFEARQVSPESAKNFFDIQFRIQQDEIGHFVYLLQTEKNQEKIQEYSRGIDAAYRQIREDVIAEVMIAKPAYMEELKNIDRGSSLAQRDIESIKSDIDTARFYLEELKTRHEDTEGFLNSAEYKKAQNIFELIDNCADADSKVLNQKLEKYLTGLWPALDELTNKFTIGVGIAAPEPNTESEQKEVQEFLNGVEVLELDKVPDNEETLEKEKTSLLEEFEVFKNLPAESGLRKAEEFHLAATGAAELRNHVLLQDDLENSMQERSRLIETFAAQLEALRSKADELGPVRVMFDDESTAVDSKETVQPDINLDELAPPAPVDSGIEIPPAPSPKYERDAQREKWLESKKEFRAIKKQYHDALNAHYQAHQAELKNRGMFEKIRTLGMKKDAPDLPEAVKALQAEYLDRRKSYARELDAALTHRGEKFELTNDDMKRAFARKFLIAPQNELLKMQERNFFPSETSKIIKNILGNLSKNKWNIRIGTVLVAGAVGAATGGATAFAFLGAAGLSGAKIGLNIGAGLAGGALAKKYTQIKVDRTTENLNKKSEAFSLDKMDDLEESVLEASKAVTSAKKQQKIATVVAGGLAGLTTGVGAAVYENVTESAASATPPTGASAGLGEQQPIEPSETSKIVPKIVETPVTTEIPPQPAFIQSMSLPYEKGGLTLFEHKINDLSFGSEFKPAALSEPETNELKSFVKLKSDDFLAADKNIPAATFESQLQAAIEKKFGDKAWWAESPIKSVSVGSIESVLLPETGSATTVPEAATETAVVNRLQVSPELIRGEYVVQKGDTLWGIAKEQFADQLKHLSPQEQNAVLARLFEKVEENPFLLESLNLQSGNNIDKIRAGETIELSGLQAELATVLETRDIVQMFQKSAPLSVEADTDVKSVPITVVEKPIPAGTEVVINNERSYTEAAPTKPVATPEVTAATKTFYETAPQHVRDEIRQYFNNPKAFAAAVNNAAYKIDARAYDFFDTLSNPYKSPYEYLGGKTLAEYAALEAKPNAELRAILTAENIKYEAFLEWQDKIKDLEQGIPHSKTDTISKMFEQSVFQDKVSEKNNSYINP
jgi:LysM repeat protein